MTKSVFVESRVATARRPAVRRRYTDAPAAAFSPGRKADERLKPYALIDFRSGDIAVAWFYTYRGVAAVG
jgi:hypothetical protein